MARFDHVDSTIGIVRAPYASDIAQADWDKVIGIGINGTGKAVKGAGQTGVIGVAVPGRTVYRAGAICDIMKKGDIVDVTGLNAGTKYYVDNTGAITATASGNVYVGHTVEADRLVVDGF